jgi:hypothetical protein
MTLKADNYSWVTTAGLAGNIVARVDDEREGVLHVRKGIDRLHQTAQKDLPGEVTG